MAVTSANRLPTVPARGLRGWVQRHPAAAFFILAYTLSWLIWIPAMLAGASQVLLIPGAFGPAVAAYLVLRITGGSVGAWAARSSTGASSPAGTYTPSACRRCCSRS